MSVENVKKLSLKEKLLGVVKNQHVIQVGCVALGICVGLGINNISSLTNSKEEIPEEILITRTMLASRTEYEGVWAQDIEGLFEVYMPGEKLDDRNYNSIAVTAYRDDDYDGSVMKAYGVYRSKVKFDCNIDEDPNGIIDLCLDNIVADIGNVCKAGNPVGSYDISFIILDDGRTAMKVTGSVTMTQIFQEQKGDHEIYEEEVEYPIIIYITLEKGYPVALWCCHDRFDYFAGEEAPRELEQMVYTLWQTRFTGELPVYETVPTYLDSNRLLHVDEKWLEERNKKEQAYGEDGTLLPDAPVSGFVDIDAESHTKETIKGK